jgi:hypothetical protein
VSHPSPASRPAATADGLPPSPFAGLPGALDRFIARGLAKVTGTTVAPYQTAVIRIGFALTELLFLLREWPHRDELYGPGSPWSWSMAKALIGTNHAFSVLMWSDSRLWFEIVYTGAILSALSLLLGWRTRTSALFFMIGVLSLQNRSVFEGDGGDNVLHIMAIYLVFARCGQVWSLDSRRARRRAAEGRPGATDRTGLVLWAAGAVCLVAVTATGLLSGFWAVAFWVALAAQALWWLLGRYAAGEPRTVADMVANLMHAGAMLVIVVEVCFIYADAGWFKIQGSHWQDGTALYYPLHINDFTPWPAFSHLLAASGLVVMVITYGTVIVQVAFPFTLLNRKAKNVLLVLMMCEHAGIAVTLGLPFFSLAMISADAVFLPTSFLLWFASRATGLLSGSGRRGRVPAQRREPEAAASTLLG